MNNYVLYAFVGRNRILADVSKGVSCWKSFILENYIVSFSV